MSTRYVSYEEFEPTKLRFGNIDTKTIKDSKGKNYYNVNLVYNYGTDEKPIFDEVLLEYPLLKSSKGIKEDDSFGKIVWSINGVFEDTDEHTRFIGKLTRAYEHLCSLLAASRGDLNRPDLTKEAVKLFFKNPVYTPLDKQTGEPILGRRSSCFFKLIKGSSLNTLFTDLDAKPIDWKLLSEVEMEYQPVVQWPTIYVSGTLIRLQQKVLSAVVTKAVAINSETIQIRTIEKIKTEQPTKVDELRKQLSKLVERNLDSPEDKKEDEEKVTDNTIVGTPIKTYGFGKTPSVIKLE
jgi:uncharacterized coiled-coil protein SlyX